jgi:GNAT superfamily N-acetyltransferase
MLPSEPKVEFRSATLDEADTIRDFVRGAYAKWVPVIGREPLPMTADYQRAVREHQIDILSIDGVMTGLLETMLHPDHLWIENIAVGPGSQGKGFGRQLLSHAERKAAVAGCADIRLLTNEAFGGNVAFYEKAGYVIERREPFRGGTTVYMSKRLGR